MRALGWIGYGYATVVEILSTALSDGTTSPHLSGVDKATGKKIPMVRGFAVSMQTWASTSKARC